MHFAPSQKQEWVGTTILYQRKVVTKKFFGLIKKVSFGQTHQGKVVDATAKSIAFRLAPSFNFFTGKAEEDSNNVAWVPLEELNVLDVLPSR